MHLHVLGMIASRQSIEPRQAFIFEAILQIVSGGSANQCSLAFPAKGAFGVSITWPLQYIIGRLGVSHIARFGDENLTSAERLEDYVVHKSHSHIWSMLRNI